MSVLHFLFFSKAKVISELEKAKTGLTGGTPAAAANSAETAGLKDKVATFSKNFANLQSEYDQVDDAAETNYLRVLQHGI